MQTVEDMRVVFIVVSLVLSLGGIAISIWTLTRMTEAKIQAAIIKDYQKKSGRAFKSGLPTFEIDVKSPDNGWSQTRYDRTARENGKLSKSQINPDKVISVEPDMIRDGRSRPEPDIALQMMLQNQMMNSYENPSEETNPHQPQSDASVSDSCQTTPTSDSYSSPSDSSSYDSGSSYSDSSGSYSSDSTSSEW